AYEGTEVQAASGERDVQYEDRADAAAVRQAARGEAHGSGGAHVGEPRTDPTLEHPRCVFQIMKRHFARYTPEAVEQACGVPQETFRRICELITENSGRDKTMAWVYSVGWTGGGILALRGHASIQGSTDIPTLFDLLPGYIPMPHAHTNENLNTFVA